MPKRQFKDLMRDIPKGRDQSPKNFCILPWNLLELKPTGTVKICCVAAREISIDGKPAIIGRQKFDEIWNSRYMRDIRKAMLKGERLPECEYCRRQDASGIQAPSFRDLNNREWMLRYDTSMDGMIEMARKMGATVKSPPSYLQLSLGNGCNLKCRMCCSDYSDQIERDPVHSKWSPNSPFPPRAEAASWYEDDSFFTDLMANPKLLQKLYVTGGEPMMSVRLQKILDVIVEAGRPTSVDISLNTNGTLANPRILERLELFRNAVLGCSIDAYDPYFEYIRFPGKWNAVRRTLDKFREHPKLIVSVNPTVQAYNALNIVELFQFCDEQELICTPQIMYGPEHLTMLVMPRPARDEAAGRLRSYISSPATTDSQRKNRELAKPIMEYLIQTPEPVALEHLTKEFMVFTNDLDISRGQSFRTTHSTLYNYFASSQFGWCDELRHCGATVM